MRLIGIGLAVALALGAIAPTAALAAAKANGPGVIDPKARAAGMKEAPAAVTAVGAKCTVTDARFIGEAPDPKSKQKTKYYEVACQEGIGYVVSANADPAITPVVENCLEAARPGPDGKPSSTACVLPGNADAKPGLLPYITKSAVKCTPDQVRGIGSGGGQSFFEVVCTDKVDYVLMTSTPPDPNGKVTMLSCLEFAPTDLRACKTSSAADQLAIADGLIGTANKGCAVKDRRYILSTKDGSFYFEVACNDGKGYVVQRTGDGALGKVIDCAAADGVVPGGCTLTDARAAQTEQAGLYSRLAKKVGYDCAVSKYAPLPSPAGVEVVELQCSNRPDGAIAMFKGVGGEVYDCARSELVGYRCSFTHPDADNDHLTADLKTLGKTSCIVSGSRIAGVSTDKHGFVEVSCSDGNPGWVVEYTMGPLTPLSVLTCGQSAQIGSACKLPGNVKK